VGLKEVLGLFFGRRLVARAATSGHGKQNRDSCEKYPRVHRDHQRD
jgi:hypothetical protein